MKIIKEFPKAIVKSSGLAISIITEAKSSFLVKPHKVECLMWIEKDQIEIVDSGIGYEETTGE